MAVVMGLDRIPDSKSKKSHDSDGQKSVFISQKFPHSNFPSRGLIKKHEFSEVPVPLFIPGPSHASYVPSHASYVS